MAEQACRLLSCKSLAALPSSQIRLTIYSCQRSARQCANCATAVAKQFGTAVLSRQRTPGAMHALCGYVKHSPPFNYRFHRFHVADVL